MSTARHLSPEPPTYDQYAIERCLADHPTDRTCKIVAGWIGRPWPRHAADGHDRTEARP